MPGPSPFAEDWRDCLRVHYQHVIRNQDHTTEGSLTYVLHDIGFSDAQLAELKVRATMRADDMDPDFVPDFDVLQMRAIEAEPPVEAPVFAVALPNSPVEPDDDPAPLDESAEHAPPEIVEAIAASDALPEDAPTTPPVDEEPPDYRAEGPQQLAMF